MTSGFTGKDLGVHVTERGLCADGDLEGIASEPETLLASLPSQEIDDRITVRILHHLDVDATYFVAGVDEHILLLEEEPVNSWSFSISSSSVGAWNSSWPWLPIESSGMQP